MSVRRKVSETFGEAAAAVFAAILTIACIAAACAVIYLIGKGFYAAWPHRLSNEQIISETKKCEKAGMKAEQLMNGLTSEVTHIQCIPKDRK